MFLCLPPAPPGQLPPRWGRLGQKTRIRQSPGPSGGSGDQQKRLKGWSGHLLPACRGRLCGQRMIPKTERWIGLTGTLLPPSDLEHSKWKEQGKPQRPCLLRFLLGPQVRRDSLGAKSKDKEMDKASALFEELLDIITSCPDGGDIRPCRLFTWEPRQALCWPGCNRGVSGQGSFPLRRTPTTEKKRFIKCNGREQCWWEWGARPQRTGKRETGMEALSEPEVHEQTSSPPTQLALRGNPRPPRVVDCEKVSSSFSLDSQGSGVEEGPEEGELREEAPGDSRSFRRWPNGDRVFQA